MSKDPNARASPSAPAENPVAPCGWLSYETEYGETEMFGVVGCSVADRLSLVRRGDA